jgi:hypothetical protein
MTITNEFESLTLIETETSNTKDDEFRIPIDISDIINICREYNKLGWHVQQQVENILEVGVEESIKSGYVKKESLPLVKYFLKRISENPYFGDAVSQAHDCIKLIQEYERAHSIKYQSKAN